MILKLVVNHADTNTPAYLPGTRFVIGRKASQYQPDLCRNLDLTVSPKHLVLKHTNAGWCLEKLPGAGKCRPTVKTLRNPSSSSAVTGLAWAAANGNGSRWTQFRKTYPRTTRSLPTKAQRSTPAAKHGGENKQSHTRIGHARIILSILRSATPNFELRKTIVTDAFLLVTPLPI